MNRGQLPATAPTRPGTGLERMSGRNPSAGTPNDHHVAGTEPNRAELQSKHGRPRTHPAPHARTLPPPAGVPPASMPAGDTLTHTNHLPQKPLDTGAGQLSPRAPSSAVRLGIVPGTV